MKMILCLDDRSGMMFNRRRQSKDRAVIEDILKLSAGCSLRMNGYSGKMFSEYGSSGHTEEEDFADRAGEGDFCFVENIQPEQYLDRVEELIIYRWNRSYPGDLHFDEKQIEGWKNIETTEMKGNSHEKITREIWRRN